MTNHRILHLGAGIQSGAIYALMVDGEIEPADYALFADTQAEPAWVYEQLDYLDSLGGPTIVRVSAGNLATDLMQGTNTTGHNFASVPFYTTYQEGVKGGKKPRQCTMEYKIRPMELWIRRELLGLKPKQRIPKDVLITSLFGFSTDEPTRAVKMQVQYGKQGPRWAVEFPLFSDELLMTKDDCRKYITERSGFEWRSSRCTFCPLQRNVHFAEIKNHDPDGWELAVSVDEGIRTTGAIANRDMQEIMYTHRACVPLASANLDEGQGSLFDDDGCDQGCFL